MAWNLHDWSAKRESSSNARPFLLNVIGKTDIVFLNEIRNIKDLYDLVSSKYEVIPTPRLAYANQAMLDKPKLSLVDSRAQGHSHFFEYYALLVRKGLNITFKSIGHISINAPRSGERSSSRIAETAPPDFDMQYLDGESVMVCRGYRPAWLWGLDLAGAVLFVAGVHTKPLGSKEKEGAFSTMAQSLGAVRWMNDQLQTSNWVVCGDFYADPGQLAYQLTNEHIACSVQAPGRNTNHPSSGAGCIADYFVLGPGCTGPRQPNSIDISRWDPRYSDHDPVTITLSWS